MRVLVDASMPRGTAAVVEKAGHTARDVRDLGMTSASDDLIARRARRQRLCIFTRDFDFANIRWYPPARYAGIVVFAAPERASRQVVLGMVRALLARKDIVANLPGRLAIVEPSRVRIRPPID
jgi:hypothetical protein